MLNLSVGCLPGDKATRLSLANVSLTTPMVILSYGVPFTSEASFFKFFVVRRPRDMVCATLWA